MSICCKWSKARKRPNGSTLSSARSSLRKYESFVPRFVCSERRLARAIRPHPSDGVASVCRVTRRMITVRSQDYAPRCRIRSSCVRLRRCRASFADGYADGAGSRSWRSTSGHRTRKVCASGTISCLAWSRRRKNISSSWRC
uniref:Uncharacterized protein n=1 Tax=Anopheles maculatus TaxID=74869 RepID=A0A182ST33_9DIPT